MVRIKKSAQLQMRERHRADFGPEYYVEGGFIKRRGPLRKWLFLRWRGEDVYVGTVDDRKIRVWNWRHREAEPLKEKLQGKDYVIILD